MSSPASGGSPASARHRLTAPPKPGVAHPGGADVLDQPVDVGRVLGAVLQALHRGVVVVLHRLPELVHLVGVDAGAGILKPVESVDPAHFARSRRLSGRAARAAQLDVGVALSLAGRGPPEAAEEGRLDEVVPVSAHPCTIPHRTCPAWYNRRWLPRQRRTRKVQCGGKWPLRMCHSSPGYSLRRAARPQRRDRTAGSPDGCTALLPSPVRSGGRSGSQARAVV